MNEQDPRRIRWMEIIGCISLVFALALLTLMLLTAGGCTAPEILGPSDKAIRDQEDRVGAALTPEEKAAELAALERMKADRAAADARVQTAGGALNYVVPGAGAILGLGYGIWQKLRGSRVETAARVTFAALDKIAPKLTPDELKQLIVLLETDQSAAGVRDVVQRIRGKPL